MFFPKRFRAAMTITIALLGGPPLAAAPLPFFAGERPPATREDYCAQRLIRFQRAGRPPIDWHRPQGVAVVVSGEPVCARLLFFAPGGESAAYRRDASLPDTAAYNNEWTAGFLGLVEPDCPLTLPAAPGGYLIELVPAVRQFVPMADGSRPQALCDEPPPDPKRIQGLRINSDEVSAVTWRSGAGVAPVYGNDHLRKPSFAWRDSDEQWKPVAAGSFWMGCDLPEDKCPQAESPGYEVEIPREFRLMDREVSLRSFFRAQ